MFVHGALVCLVFVLPIVCAFIVEWRSIDGMPEKLNEMPDERYLLPLMEGEATRQIDSPSPGSVHRVWESTV